MSEFDIAGEAASDEAKSKGQAALGKAKDVASDAQEVANDSMDGGRAYAKGAINAAGKKIDGAKRQLGNTADYLVKAINDEPVKAVLITALLSSLLTAVLMSALQSDDRYY